MSRLYQTGFEWQSVTAGVEFDTVTGSPTISTSVLRSGAASLRTNVSATAAWVGHTYTGAGSATNRFFRVYLRIATAPGADAVAIYLFRDGTNGNLGNIRLNSNRTLELWDEQAAAQQGSDSSALSLNTWYRVEMSYNRTSGAIEAFIDGVSFASGTTITGADANVMRWGVIDSATCDLYWDDVAINNSAGSVNNGLPGAGSIVASLPTAAGDNAATTGIFSYINEVPPSDTATSGSTMIELDSNAVVADYNVTDSATLGIDSYDTITAISILARVREEAAGTSSYQLRVKSASGGTVTSTAAADAGNATARTNPNGTTAFGRPLISETDPTTGVAWTPTGTNSIDNMQIGVTNVDADSTPDLWVLTMAAMIEYAEGVSPGGTTYPGYYGPGGWF